MKKLKLAIFSFLGIGIMTMFLADAGIIIFNKTGFYIIHPAIYLLVLMLGLGWVATAIACYFEAKLRINNFTIEIKQH